MVLRFISAFKALLGFSGKPADTVAEVIQEPGLPGWKTETIKVSSFVKVGRIAMCHDGLAIYSDVDDRGFILLNGDIDAVLDGEKRDVLTLSVRNRVGFAKLSASGRALNFSISPYYYTVPLRSVLAVLDGRNRKGALFIGR
ncbi:MAG: hypothetical protein WCJ93_11445 [Methanomicrobiales archaeon]